MEHLNFYHIETNSLEAVFRFPLKSIEDKYNQFVFHLFCNVRLFGLFLYYVTIRTLRLDKILIYFSLMCTRKVSKQFRKIKYSISIFEVRSNNNEYELHSYIGFVKDKPIAIDWFGAPGETIPPNKYICKIKFYDIHNCSEILLKSVNFKRIDKICKDFEQLNVDSKNVGDVVLKSGDIEFSALKLILSAHSPVFAAMFGHNMKESEESVVLIEDIEPDILREMLDFMYTSKVKDLESKVFDLYKVADRYELEGLKIMCSEVLFRTMSIKNVIDIFVLADFYNNENLRSEALDFVKLHLKDVIESPEFESLNNTNPGLVIDIRKLFIKP